MERGRRIIHLRVVPPGATPRVLHLMSSTLSHHQASSPALQMDLPLLLPRLLPFLPHPSASVRSSVLHALLSLCRTLSHNTETSNQPSWTVEFVTTLLSHVFLRSLVETSPSLRSSVRDLWREFLRRIPRLVLVNSACAGVSGWITLAMSPVQVPLNLSWFGEAISSLSSVYKEPGNLWIGGENPESRPSEALSCRLLATELLGCLSVSIVTPVSSVIYPRPPLDTYCELLVPVLKARSGIGRTVISLLLASWCREHAQSSKEDDDTIVVLPATLKNQLSASLQEILYYDEIGPAFTKIQKDIQSLLSSLVAAGCLAPELSSGSNVLTLLQCQELMRDRVPKMLSLANSLPVPQRMKIEEQTSVIEMAVDNALEGQTSLEVMCQAALAEACVCTRTLPPPQAKIGGLIRPLMAAIRKQRTNALQERAAKALAQLMKLCVERSPCPNTKVTENLILLLVSDKDHFPQPDASDESGILTLDIQRRRADAVVALRRGDSLQVQGIQPSCDSDGGDATAAPTDGTGRRRKARRPSKTASSSVQMNGIRRCCSQSSPVPSTSPAVPSSTSAPVTPVDGLPKIGCSLPRGPMEELDTRLQREGAVLALQAVTAEFGEHLSSKLPALWSHVKSVDSQLSNPEELLKSLATIETILPKLASDLTRDAVDLVLPFLMEHCVSHSLKSVRHQSARCIALLADRALLQTMSRCLEPLTALIEDMSSLSARLGAIEVILCFVQGLQDRLLDFVPLLVVPVLGRMSDPSIIVRHCASQCFAGLMQLMPLADSGVRRRPEIVAVKVEDAGMASLPESLSKKLMEQRNFLTDLLNPSALENIELDFPVDASFRRYQRAGINWLGFLNRYRLNGILCDDMGLGKTLQTISIIAYTHRKDEQSLPTLVICPSTLTGHWVHEINKFVSPSILKPLLYRGPPGERSRLRSLVNRRGHNVVIVSYEIARNDIDFFSSMEWLYCVLDEGHIIKNGKTKLSKAIKTLVAKHRLILSGTPIQNSVLELWSLFDFLMPGFLGTEKQFNLYYSRPIFQSNDAKATVHDQQTGAAALEKLHRQVLPFILRRLKEDVLDDLPEKITQDYTCELSPLQTMLYEAFVKSQTEAAQKRNGEQEEMPETPPKASGESKPSMHVFRILKYLQALCNHPKLVLNPDNPQCKKIEESLGEALSIDDISNSGKLQALKQLLSDCGIGCSEDELGGGSSMVVAPHRALVFFQHKSTLNIVEQDLLQKHLPRVSYLRLDGSVPTSSRFSIVQRFNQDPSIDLLLLTTQVGGLGLNLTGADTVIFFEHDWNPMKDLQAMDRAHRIGQKRVVNVYRLITQGTIEEKIMGLQKFKIATAKSVINAENSSLSQMGTEQLFDLFTLESDAGSKERISETKLSSKSSGLKSVLESMPELWSTDQYEDEYDIQAFFSAVHSTSLSDKESVGE
ncbi:unnamed protein product [Cyprideis torosa]|uniref:Uncharacterized protein n=1 Tax=Cyprideis torosa TaxID=163714 RepID=A0A7R8WFK7_9CRUS|nr:unnamed protein product [Cyprideis torosa]CAG0897113.1 unnamed protein product [Cyprideis torosa]